MPYYYNNSLMLQIFVMKTKLHFTNPWFDYQTNCTITNFFTFIFSLWFLRSDIAYNFQSDSFNASPIMLKLNAFLRSECANAWVFQQSLGEDVNQMTTNRLVLRIYPL